VSRLDPGGPLEDGRGVRASWLTGLVLVSLSGCGGCGGGGQQMSSDGGPTGAVTGQAVWCLVIRCDAGAPEPTCNARTCSGCCDARGLCQPGTLANGCGFGGQACTACPAPAACLNGTCLLQELCNAQTCGGCCQNDVCLAGSANVACGINGVRCFGCPPSSPCTNGECVVNPQSCPGCWFQGECQGGTLTARCGHGGATCVQCPSGTACDSTGACRALSGCTQCVAGQCCRNQQCVTETPLSCARVGAPNADCRECAQPERCGGGTELGFCVRPGSGRVGDACVWDGDCASPDGGRPLCITGLSWPGGTCSRSCEQTPCGAGEVCVFRENKLRCLPSCAAGGAACANPRTVCDWANGFADGGLTPTLACIPKCDAPTAGLFCASARCHADGRCCGLPGAVCCDSGTACFGSGRDGGASVCLADGTCS
jgi:hypothetical protein